MDPVIHSDTPVSPAMYGSPLLSWEVDEYPRHERSRTWYIAGAVVGVLLIVYAIATANFLFAVIILMVGIITLLSTFQDPEKVDVVLTTTGVVIGNSFHDYQEMKDFSIAYSPPDVKLLYLDFQKLWHPMVSIPLEDTDPNEVRGILLQYCPENLNRTDETLTDMIRRLYKL
ncbi:hypothetical protein HY734_03610 [Candidatus Uhrbacteria bacterium]|nr:hypothetical protein [Candidatus Uhrbacteria bacterium]